MSFGGDEVSFVQKATRPDQQRVRDGIRLHDYAIDSGWVEAGAAIDLEALADLENDTDGPRLLSTRTVRCRCPVRPMSGQTRSLSEGPPLYASCVHLFHFICFIHLLL